MLPYQFSNPLRRKLQVKDKPALGLWIGMESATVTEVAANLGYDWVCVDLEHGPLSLKDVLDHLRAAKGSDLAVLVRIPTASVDHVKRVLDLGSHGVLLPLINSAEELAQGFTYARYPSLGTRGIGGERATRWGLNLKEYVDVADEETLVIPLIETRQASNNIQSILEVPGLEAIFFGPSDLSQSCGHRATWEGPGVAEDILRMQEMAKNRNIATGIVARSSQDLDLRRAQGFQLVATGSDVGAMAATMRAYISQVKGEDIQSYWF